MKLYHWVVPFSSEDRCAHLIGDDMPLTTKRCIGHIINPLLATKPNPETPLCKKCVSMQGAA